MFKTILACLIISPVVAFIVYAMVMYPILRLAIIYAGGVCVFTFAVAWAIDHIHSKFKNKLN